MLFLYLKFSSRDFAEVLWPGEFFSFLTLLLTFLSFSFQLDRLEEDEILQIQYQSLLKALKIGEGDIEVRFS